MSGSPSSDADAVVFDIEADYGHFRKPHTAPAAETYGLMPRTAVAGLCAAMLGMERDSYYELFAADNSRIAVSVEAPVRRRIGGVNHLDTKGLKSKTGGAQTAAHIESHRDPTPVARLSEPRYRIFVSVDDAEIMDALDAVARGADTDVEGGDAPVYGPSMGPSQHLAWVEYVGRFPIEREREREHGHVDDDGTVAIRSAVPGDELPLVVDPDHRYVSETMTAFMAADESTGGTGRVPDGSHTVTYERSGEPLTLRAADADYTTVGEDHVVFS